MKLTATVAATALCLSTSWALAAAPAKPVKKAAVPVAMLAEASPEQIDAAGRTLTGAYECEFNQSIAVEPNAKAPGYIDVKFQKAVYTMKPIQSTTGALRLEEVKGGKRLWLQIANKSMLMDAGHRIVDGCTHASQREAMAK
jgi:hypothetical protein